jgi:uncharacterized protein (TIGR03083 family)
VTDAVRRSFNDAAEGFLAAVSALGDDDWARPGLGEWNVRDLVGHTSRALSTIESYLKVPAAEVSIRDPVEYLRLARSAVSDPAAIAQRGRDAGIALGDDPRAAIRDLVARVTSLLAATPDDATLTVVGGQGITLLAYLPTRTFELTVHTLDLVAAAGREPPPQLAGPVAACLALAARVLASGPGNAEVLLALTGRRPLPPGFSII